MNLPDIHVVLGMLAGEIGFVQQVIPAAGMPKSVQSVETPEVLVKMGTALLRISKEGAQLGHDCSVGSLMCPAKVIRYDGWVFAVLGKSKNDIAEKNIFFVRSRSRLRLRPWDTSADADKKMKCNI
ncbi:hypothetical protein SLS55_010459 [Diplodia seriata]|uniref:Uncharacterized protein n=1 Tax=Diplodia seriata TaxID=420778 RepID=A0ABR3BYK5_9PEZI